MSVIINGTNGVTFNDASLQGAAASPFGLKNRIINGDFRISQRGTTINGINTDYTYTADRWFITRGGLVNYTQGTTSPPTGFQYYGSFINQTAGNAFVAIQQAIESINTNDLLGQTVTLSAWIKAAANTAVSNSIIVTYGYATTADTKAYSTLDSGTSFALSSSAWTKCSITFTVPSNALTLVPVFYKSASFAVGDGYLITGVQLEVGSTATPFERRLYGQELINCQRYFQYVPFSGTAVASGEMSAAGMFRVEMRATPAINTVLKNTSAYTDGSSNTLFKPGLGNVGVGAASIASSFVNTNGFIQLYTTSGLTASGVYSGSAMMSAEL